jgi:hypothetical protein
LGLEIGRMTCLPERIKENNGFFSDRRSTDLTAGHFDVALLFRNHVGSLDRRLDSGGDRIVQDEFDR